LFDEVGLAEIADENPLKVLHQKLEPDDNKVGFIGISNWRLDLSKMNRVIYVSRPDPDQNDLTEPFKKRIEDTRDPRLEKVVKAIAETYAQLRDQECRELKNHPNFHGARDIYNTITQVLDFFEKLGNPEDKTSLSFAIELAVKRNFGGVILQNKPSGEWFFEQLKNKLYEFLDLATLSPIDPIFHNLADPETRHLMLFCENLQVEEIMVEEIRKFTTKVLGKENSKVKVFIDCSSKEEELAILNSLSAMVYQGYTVVLKKLDHVYGCLYELFNQRYEVRQGGVRGCYLVYDSHRQWIPVHPDFKAIVLMSDLAGQTGSVDLEKVQQPPFLNRFEKQLVRQKFLLDDTQTDLLEEGVQDLP
jgi:hypothetical protein